MLHCKGGLGFHQGPHVKDCGAAHSSWQSELQSLRYDHREAMQDCSVRVRRGPLTF